MLKPFTQKHSKRWLWLKFLITMGFFVTLGIDHWLGTHIMLATNLIWLWVDFEETPNA